MRFHTSLPVLSIEATASFYSALFGVEPSKLRSDYAKFLPGDPDVNLTFHQVKDASALLTDLHLGLELPDSASVTAAYERLGALGWISEARKTSVCCYAAQDKFWITDPNGYRWELYALVRDTEEKLDEPSGCCGPSPDASTRATCC
ncbi:MAG TPA: ArsI/CadI family heavy metal resistance metalloenzyme [Polyangiaceae bacterium]|nr:ArsI/CadI family heavy metal resistance metalloenzyme [Polyangiaceae bacterium]